MADNLTTQSTAPATPAAATVVATRSVTYSGDTASIAPVGLVTFAGADDAKTVADVPGGGGVEAAALRVTVANDSTGQIKLAAGAAAIGSVTVSSSALPSGASTLAEQQTQTTSLSVIDDWDESDRAKVNPIVGQAGIAAGAGAVGVTVPRVTLASDDPAVTALQIIDNMISGSGANISQINGVTPLMGAGNTGTGSPRVTIATDQAAVPVSVPALAVTAAVTQVADSASSVTILSLNASRKGYKLFNDSTQAVYVKEGTTATSADASYKMQPGGFYESVGPGCYTGRIDAIWVANASGSMLITELA